VALHDLDAPWRPRDLEQRHGRILRQGNQNKEVEIFNYVVQDSFDANMWEKLKNKAAIIAQAMSNNTQLRAVEDADHNIWPNKAGCIQLLLVNHSRPLWSKNIWPSP